MNRVYVLFSFLILLNFSNACTISVVSVQNDSVCIGKVATLTAFGGVSYNWGAYGNTQSIQVSPASTTSYPVTITDGMGCTAVTSATAAIRSNPNITIKSDTICTDQTAKLTAEGAYSYDWGTLGTNQSIYVKPTFGQVFSVTGTDIYGCMGTGSISMFIKPGITVNTIGDTICYGQTATISIASPNPNYTYNWGTLGQGESVEANPLTNTSYRVIATGPNGCTVEATAYVYVTQKQTVSININTLAICLGEPAMILNGVPAGGDLVGKGIYNSKFFPDSAGVGTHTIKYFYTNPLGGCVDSATRFLKVVNCNSEITVKTGIEKVSVYPNPVIDNLNVDIQSKTNGWGAVKIYTIDGKIVYNKPVYIQESQINKFEVNIGDLTDYNYKVVVYKDGENIQIPIIRAK